MLLHEPRLRRDGAAGRVVANGPWRLLILDRDPADPKWILAIVTSPGDVQPAALGDVLAILPAGAAWMRRLLGKPHATLTPMTRAHVWRIDESPS